MPWRRAYNGSTPPPPQKKIHSPLPYTKTDRTLCNSCRRVRALWPFISPTELGPKSPRRKFSPSTRLSNRTTSRSRSTCCCDVVVVVVIGWWCLRVYGLQSFCHGMVDGPVEVCTVVNTYSPSMAAHKTYIQTRIPI